MHPTSIEGYLIESVENIIFDVKGLVHPPDKIVANNKPTKQETAGTAEGESHANHNPNGLPAANTANRNKRPNASSTSRSAQKRALETPNNTDKRLKPSHEMAIGKPPKPNSFSRRGC